MSLHKIKSFITATIAQAKLDLLDEMLADCDREENKGGRLLVEAFRNKK
jgi:hypothetical protein